jgi:peptidase E
MIMPVWLSIDRNIVEGAGRGMVYIAVRQFWSAGALFWCHNGEFAKSPMAHRRRQLFINKQGLIETDWKLEGSL